MAWARSPGFMRGAEFDDEYPYQSAVVGDAFGQTITIEAKGDPDMGDE